LEILQDFPSAQPPLDYILDLIPPIQPRLFSIASSWKMYPNEAQLLVAMIKFKTRHGRERQGVCTSWLASLRPSEETLIRCWIHRGPSSFELGNDLSTPIIMVGPGTGLAPFRSFVQERVVSQQQQQQGNVGDSVLYFGCRHQEKDWFYGEEMESYVPQYLSEYHVAFSRDKMREYLNKTYVQHLLLENSASVWSILNRGGRFFLSGSALVMPQNVRDAVKEIIIKEGKKTESEAEEYLKEMDRRNRYCTETWQ